MVKKRIENPTQDEGIVKSVLRIIGSRILIILKSIGDSLQKLFFVAIFEQIGISIISVLIRIGISISNKEPAQWQIPLWLKNIAKLIDYRSTKDFYGPLPDNFYDNKIEQNTDNDDNEESNKTNKESKQKDSFSRLLDLNGLATNVNIEKDVQKSGKYNPKDGFLSIFNLRFGLFKYQDIPAYAISSARERISSILSKEFLLKPETRFNYLKYEGYKKLEIGPKGAWPQIKTVIRWIAAALLITGAVFLGLAQLWLPFSIVLVLAVFLLNTELRAIGCRAIQILEILATKLLWQILIKDIIWTLGIKIFLGEIVLRTILRDLICATIWHWVSLIPYKIAAAISVADAENLNDKKEFKHDKNWWTRTKDFFLHSNFGLIPAGSRDLGITIVYPFIVLGVVLLQLGAIIGSIFVSLGRDAIWNTLIKDVLWSEIAKGFIWQNFFRPVTTIILSTINFIKEKCIAVFTCIKSKFAKKPEIKEDKKIEDGTKENSDSTRKIFDILGKEYIQKVIDKKEKLQFNEDKKEPTKHQVITQSSKKDILTLEDIKQDVRNIIKDKKQGENHKLLVKFWKALDALPENCKIDEKEIGAYTFS